MDNKEFETPVSQPSESAWLGQQRAMRVVTAGSIVEALGGIGAVVLSILGLAGLARATMIAISIIAIGAALLFAGGAMASRSPASTHRTSCLVPSGSFRCRRARWQTK